MINLTDEQLDTIMEEILRNLDKISLLLETNYTINGKIAALKALSQLFAMSTRLNGLELSLISRMGTLYIHLFDETEIHKGQLTIGEAEYLNKIYNEAIGFVSSYETMTEILEIIMK